MIIQSWLRTFWNHLMTGTLFLCTLNCFEIYLYFLEGACLPDASSSSGAHTDLKASPTFTEDWQHWLILIINILTCLTSSFYVRQFPIREAATKALGRLLLYQAKSEGNKSIVQLAQLLVIALQDDSSEVRRRSLSCIKAVAKVLWIKIICLLCYNFNT